MLGAYALLAGIERFAIEFLRAKDDRALPGALSKAQIASIVMVIIGTTLIVKLSSRPAEAPGEWLLRGAGRAENSP